VNLTDNIQDFDVSNTRRITISKKKRPKISIDEINSMTWYQNLARMSGLITRSMPCPKNNIGFEALSTIILMTTTKIQTKI